MSHPRLSPLALALVAPALLAQSSTTSALQGVVKDATGTPLKGATVRISSPALIGGDRSAKTTENGSFRFPLLPPGTYTLQAEAPGMKPFKAIQQLALGETTTSNIRMAPEAAAVVEITGAAGTVEGAASNTTLTAAAIDAVPLGRDLTQVAALTPGVTASDSTSGASVRAWGGDGSANAYTIDGLNVGDTKSGEKWVYANPDWFSQVSVGGLGAGAEFGGFSGALINGVVKSGGNDVQGSLSAYYQKNSWAALRDNPRLAFGPNNSLDGRPLYDGEYRDLTFTLGGPIVKDKLWYFISAESIKDSATDSPVGVSFPVELKNPRALGKLTWQVNPNITWDAFLEYDVVDREHKYADYRYAAEATQKQGSPSRLFTTNWTQSLSPTAVLNLHASTLNARDDRYSYNPGGYTMEVSGSAGLDNGVTVANGATTGLSQDLFPELIGKSFWGNATRGNLLRENFRGRTSFSATLDLFGSGVFSASDSHALRMGLDWEQSANDERRWVASPNGVAYRTRIRSGALRPRYALTGIGREVKSRMDREAFFIQDTWTVNSRLQIRPGLRFETFKGRAYGGDNLWDTKTLAPRLGFTFNVTEDQSQVLKLHLGKYYTGLSSDYFQRAIPGTYQNTNVFYWGSSSNIVDPRNPTAIPFDPTLGGPDYNYSYNFNASTLDPNAKQPYTEEAVLGYDWRFARNWTVSLTAVYRGQKDILVQTDPTYANPAFIVDQQVIQSPVTGQLLSVSVTDQNLANPYLSGHKYLITNSDQAKNYYRMLTVSLSRAFADRWSFDGSITWAKAEGNYNTTAAQDPTFADPNSLINSRGRLPYTNDKEGRLRATYEFPWAWTTRLSLSYTYLSGERYTPFIDLSQSTLELNQTSLGVYAAPLGSERYPSRHLADLRLSQDLNFSRRVKTEVFLDVFNLFNDTKPYSWNTTIYDDARGYFNIAPAVDGQGNSVYQKPFFVDDPRRVRVGFKLKF